VKEIITKAENGVTTKIVTPVLDEDEAAALLGISRSSFRRNWSDVPYSRVTPKSKRWDSDLLLGIFRDKTRQVASDGLSEIQGPQPNRRRLTIKNPHKRN
jgi:hypothetical protein